MSDIAGFNAKVTIDGVSYKAAQYEIDDTAEMGDTTNFESDTQNAATTVAKEIVPTKSSCRITLTRATFDPDDNPFAAPLALFRGLNVEVKIFPEGAGGDPHNFPQAKITNVRMAGDAGGLQPITLTLETHGTYTLAGEAA